MENRKENLTTATNKGSLMSHQITVCKTIMTDTETRKFPSSDTAGNKTMDQGKVSSEPTYCQERRRNSPGEVKHYDWPEVTGWPFWPKHQSFHCQRAQFGRGSIRRQIFDGREGHKGNLIFSELRDCVYKGSQGSAGNFGSQSK